MLQVASCNTNANNQLGQGQSDHLVVTRSTDPLLLGFQNYSDPIGCFEHNNSTILDQIEFVDMPNL